MCHCRWKEPVEATETGFSIGDRSIRYFDAMKELPPWGDLGVDVVVDCTGRATVRSGAQGDDVVEQIDIGGPAMLLASAKNFSNVAIVVSPESYPAIIEAVGTGGTIAHFDGKKWRRLASPTNAHLLRVKCLASGETVISSISSRAMVSTLPP